MAKITNIRKPKPAKAKHSRKLISHIDSADRYFTVKELAQVVKLSESFIYTLVSRKEIPHIKLFGKKVLFDKADINNWIEQRKVAAK